MKMDMIIRNAFVYNSFTQSFAKKDVAVKDGQFVWIHDHIEEDADVIVDGTGKYMIPGLVDIHMHIESSMSIPSRFSDAVLFHGTTTVVADPHEIANVFGLEGIQSYISSETALDIFYGIPSSVPSTNPNLETTGGIIGIEEVKELLKNDKVRCLGEVMNFQDVCFNEDSRAYQIVETCKQMRFDMPLEGHCPKISGQDLATFIARGITADHTQQSKESIMEKICSGMFLEIQRKSITSEVIQELVKNQVYDYFCFATDDVMPDLLLTGHLNELVKLAVELGMPFEKAIYCATFTPSRRMHLEDRGAICPGRKADFILLSDTKSFTISEVYKNGKKVQKENQVEHFPEHFYHSVRCKKAECSDFEIKLNGKRALCNVIKVNPYATFTDWVQEELPIQDGILQLNGNTLMTVFERYGKNGNIAHAIVKNTLKKQGAVATTWAHDHHNLMVMGNNREDMVVAQHALLEMQGGMVVVEKGQVVAKVQLEIGGIVSALPIEELGKQLGEVRQAMHDLGYEHNNAIMSISTLALLVTPKLKVSDFGMIDTVHQVVVPLVEKLYEN